MQYSNLSAHILALHMKALESCYKQKLTDLFITFNINGTLALKILSKLFYCMFKNNKYVNAIPILEIAAWHSKIGGLNLMLISSN